MRSFPPCTKGRCKAAHLEMALVTIIIKAEDGSWGGRSVRLVLSLLCPFSILIALEKKENHKALKALILPALQPPAPSPILEASTLICQSVNQQLKHKQRNAKDDPKHKATDKQVRTNRRIIYKHCPKI